MKRQPVSCLSYWWRKEQARPTREADMLHQHFQGDATDAAAPVPLHLQLAERWHL